MPAGDRQPPSLRQEAIGADPRVRLSGDWTLSFLAPRLEALRRQLQAVAGDAGWDLSGVTRLDSFGAVLLWRHWGRRRPDGLVLPAELEGIFGRLAELGERAWIGAYVATRHAWLAGHRRSDLRATAYRMEAFQRLAEQAYWGLELPLVVRGAERSPATLYATPPGCYDGPQPGTRAIALQTPLARGLDVRLLQLALSERGIAIKADGIFGRTSANLLRNYQLSAGLPATGVADPALIGQLVT